MCDILKVVMAISAICLMARENASSAEKTTQAAGEKKSGSTVFDYHAGKSSSDMSDKPAYAVDWAAEGTPAYDVSRLLEAPAGKAGRIQIKDGRLAYPDGRRFRIWGINATGAGALPSKENAPRLAARLAALGINCVRFHFLDRPAPAGILAANSDNTREFDPAQMESLDFFVVQLKQRGIYSDLNLNVAHPYKPGDGVKDCELLGFAKSLTFFDSRLLELQREYARQLLTHKNPHTGAIYAKEPAVALVEFVNENSLVEAWMTGRLLGKNTRKNPGTWTDIPASYAADLTDKFNVRLKKKYSADVLKQWREQQKLTSDEPIARLAPDQFGKASKERFQAEAEFYLEIERDFYLSMAKFLREELGVQALLLGNSDHGHSKTGYPQVAGTSLLDVVDGHVYWQHPNYQTDSQTGKRTGYTIENTPMVDNPLQSSVVQLSRSAFAGKPYTVSEVNHPFPSEYACEGIPILAAYAALQDWDGIFWYSLSHKDAITLETKVAGHFDLAMDPVKIAQLPAGAMMFLRGDVRPAAKTITRSYTREQVRESIRMTSKERPYFTPGFPLVLPLRDASRIASFDGPPTATFPAEDSSNPIRSDTNELAWYYGDKGTGLVAVDTERSQALIGFVGATNRARLKNLSADAQTPFCAITLSALDDQPIARSRKLLLTATARVANSGMEWNDKRNTLAQWGNAPTRIEPVVATLRLTGLADARTLSASPLNGAGQPTGAAISANRSGSEWTLNISAPTTSYIVTVSP
ncbi:MAG: hypothetical protein NTX50_26245 [Candidatus Sumerlaeota bacterium]|nr:hypothetical protein [Candidatus Sumerlaeota bacterium]